MKNEGKNIKELAEKIVELEKKCQLENNISNMKELEQLIQKLSLEEMLKIDTYIKEKNLLTK